MAEDMEARRAACERRLDAFGDRIAALQSSIRASARQELEAGPEHPRPSMAEDMEAQRAALERRFAASRDRFASFKSSITRSGAHQVLSRVEDLAFIRVAEDLAGLKKKLLGLESDLGQALSLNFRRQLECEGLRESISAEDAEIEQLIGQLTDQVDRRGRCATVISNALEAVQALETKADEDDTWRTDIQKALRWYQEFLGFQVVTGGEGVKFVFDKVDLQSPEKEFSVSLKIDNDRYILLQCSPAVEDSEELMKDLNLSNNLAKFARIIRQRFQAAALAGDLPASPTVCSDASALPISSPVIKSVDSRSKNDRDRSNPQSKNMKPLVPAKRQASALSAASPSSVRRSPRFVGKDVVQNLSRSHQHKTGR
uniref:Kinetochore protein SPC25 n=1 Tax=Hordeum vulgare subsp. vulgare TaxID=112509 RepID=F2EB02_HORVV|nr:predicted protein [Hordeum vulgare subsp. vulgare]